MESTGHPFAGTLTRLGDDQELFQELIAYFQEDAPELLAAIRNSAAVGRAAGVMRAAHSLRSLLANFDAEKAMSAAGAIEQMAKSGKLQMVSSTLADLEREVHWLRIALDGYAA